MTEDRNSSGSADSSAGSAVAAVLRDAAHRNLDTTRLFRVRGVDPAPAAVVR
ncbi:hypothetical protein [Streptomyces sp. Inha503]|uniref:hypothetical protein n=1 Tax=Streptomyces sp. Inha503 TaxID=3383314 RepID=UPI00399F0DEA